MSGFFGPLLAFGVAAYVLSVLALAKLRFRWGLRLLGLGMAALVGAMMGLFLAEAAPALYRYGPALFLRAEWDPPREIYGLLNALVGTVLTASLALLMAMPLAVSFAAAINEYAHRRFRAVLGSLMDLSAAMPTVVFGLWGLFTLQHFARWVNNLLASLPPPVGWLFALTDTGLGILTASILLAIMVTPYAAAVIREGYALIPREIVEAIYAIGATRFEAILIKLRYVRNYIVGGMFLALGRALGETVAVAMVIGGNLSRLPTSLSDTGITISSLIALQFPNAHAYQYMVPTLYAGALILAFISVVLNLIAVRYLFKR